MTDQLGFDFRDLKKVDIEVRTFHLDEFPPNDHPDMQSPPPTKELVESIMLIGITMPPCWIRDGSIIEFAAGRRRIKAARKAVADIREAGLDPNHEEYNYLTQVKCMVFFGPKADAKRAIALIENFRSENPITDGNFISELISQGMKMEEIKLYTGKNKAQIERLLEFAHADPALADGLNSGLINPNVAKQVIRLSDNNKSKVMDILSANKSVTGETIAELKRVQSRQAAQSVILPNMDFKPSKVQLVRSAMTNAGFRTDPQGDVIVQVDGETLRFTSMWDGSKISEPAAVGNGRNKHT